MRDENDDALYFSRAPLPFFRDGAPALTGDRLLKHLGIYSYEPALLRAFVKWSPAWLEGAERLEQLRALDHGVRVRVARVQHDSIGVDTPADARRVVQLLKKRGHQ